MQEISDNNRQQFNYGLFRWFLVALTNAWKHLVFPRKKINDLFATERIKMVKEFLKNKNKLSLEARIDENTSLFVVRNLYIEDKDRNPLLGSKNQKTAFALTLAKIDLCKTLDMEDGMIKCEFYGDKDRREWFTTLSIISKNRKG